MLRGRSFSKFRNRLKNVRDIAPFGINFVVNRVTIGDIDKAVAVAAEAGASEFLLLPEQKTLRSDGIDENTLHELRSWTAACRTNLRLAISEAGASGFPTCDPLVKEKGLRSYAHIDASGVLKQSSFDRSGVQIETSVFDALGRLLATNGRMQ
jgi:MoaA/NifB/PqqE/SkfB family radical SAM enzyme